MEFVHHDVNDGERFAFAKSHVRENFCGAADDGRIAVDRCITGRKPNVLGAKFLTKRHPLFIHQGLDWASIDTPASVN